jgi:hypothetical protein
MATGYLKGENERSKDNMRDITSLILKAINVNIDWSVNGFYAFMEDAEKCGISISYSEGEEYWASMGYNNELIGHIWRPNPLVFINSESAPLLGQIANNYSYAVVIEVTGLWSDELLVGIEPEIADRMGSIVFNEPTSAGDIWLSSVT